MADGFSSETAVQALSVVGKNVAWATAIPTSGACGAGPGSCDSSALLLSVDSGQTWHGVTASVPVTSVAPVSTTTAWAVASNPSRALPPNGTALVQSTDGGRTWHQEKN